MTAEHKFLMDKIEALEEKHSDKLPKEVVKLIAKIIITIENDSRFLSFGRKRPLWRYMETQGIWIENAELFIRQQVASLLHKESKYRSRIVNEVVFYFIDNSIIPDVILNAHPEIMVVKNGNLNLNTGKLSSKFVPEQYHTIRIDIDYKPDAVCPTIEKRLNEIMASTTDIQALLEVFGYCLYKGHPYDILVMFVGEGANGKSVVIEMFEYLLGDDNVSNKGLHSISTNRFSLSALFGKLANIAGEISSNEIKYTDRIKDLTGGGFIDAERKYESSFKYRNIAKMVFSSNTPPAIQDSSYGFWRRMRRFDFPNTFSRENPNTIPRDVLLKEMTTEKELEGFLVQAVLGWQRLRANGQLTGAKTPEEERIEYLRVSDPAKYFGEVLLSQESGAKPIIKASLYEVYMRWCHIEKKDGLSEKGFHTRIRKAASYISEKQKTKERDRLGNRKRVRVYANVSLDTKTIIALGTQIGDIELFLDTEEQSTFEEGSI